MLPVERFLSCLVVCEDYSPSCFFSCSSTQASRFWSRSFLYQEIPCQSAGLPCPRRTWRLGGNDILVRLLCPCLAHNPFHIAERWLRRSCPDLFLSMLLDPSGRYHLLLAYSFPPFCYSLVIAEPHSGHLIVLQGSAIVCITFLPHWGQTQNPLGPALAGPPILPLPTLFCWPKPPLPLLFC